MAKESSDVVMEALRQRMAKLVGCYNQNDFKGFSEYYTEDCKLSTPGRPITKGREELIHRCETMGNDGLAKMVLSDEEYVLPGCDMAAENGKYRFFDKEDKEVDHGKFVSVWKKVEGQWFIHFDVYNSIIPKREPSPLDMMNERLKEFLHLWNAGDIKALSNFYTPDCKLFPPNAPVCVGREDTIKNLQSRYDSGLVQKEALSIEAHKMGDDIIADHATWVFYDKDGVKCDHGSSFSVWKRLEDGKWYWHYAAFNSEEKP